MESTKTPKLLITPVEAGKSIGLSAGSTYNKLSAGTFPIPIVTIGGRKMVRVRDLERTIDELPEIAPKPKKRGRGAPTKAERLEKAGNGIKVFWPGSAK